MFVPGNSDPVGPRVRQLVGPTRTARLYRRALHSQGTAIYPYGTGQLGDMAGGADFITDALGGAQAQVAQLKTALTITTAASVAAAIAGALLLFRTAKL